MTSKALDALLAAQRDCVAAWQVRELGWSAGQVKWRLGRLRPVPRIDGVWTSTRGELSPHQRWKAATLSAPGTGLAGLSSALLHGFGVLRGRETFVVVAREGTGGPRRTGDLLVCRSKRCDFVERDGITATSPAATIMDLTPNLDDAALRRLVIEALRLRRVTVDELFEVLPRRRGAPRLRELLEAVEGLPFARCRSNAEGVALVRLKEQGRRIPEVNVRVAGHEVDLYDPATRQVIEIDGPAFHADPRVDAVRDADLRRAGVEVKRRPSGDAYDRDAAW